MSYGPGRSPLVTGVLVGVGVWLVGALVGILVAVAFRVPEGFSTVGFGATIYVAGVALAFYAAAAQTFPLVWLVPTGVGFLAAIAGGAIVVAQTSRVDRGWPAVKAGASIVLGVFLCSMVVLAVYLVPSTPFSNVPVPARYVSLLFGSLLFPALFGALGGAIQHSLAGEQ
ncbi:hypothetical protein [Halapricum salinum]|uniref:Uncharacterized protein n=1 Tax=Halapricum salinum TaxID=1457250 RepID=A0A4D6HAR9_9EURY|nr:hypothetical protein [Halapricum salinum]QCC51029.1 hypothetical protein DV733_07125 [Halapricum salinum]